MKGVVSPTVFRYLGRRLAGPVLLALAVFTLVDLLGEGADRFAGWFRAGVALEGFGYLALRVPFMVSQLLPVAVLGGVMFAFGMLHRAEEVIALQAAGISRAQIALPVFALAGLLTVLNFGLAERLVPLADQRARHLLEERLRPDRQRAATRVWRRTRVGFVSAARYDAQRHELHDVTIFNLGTYPRLNAILRVRTARWNGRDWLLSGIDQVGFAPDGVPAAARAQPTLDLSPADLATPVAGDPEELGLAELDRLIADLGRHGVVPAALRVLRARKFALPAACLVMAALALAGSLEPPPRRAALGANIALGLGAGVGYWLLLGFTLSLGNAGVLAAWLAAWLPNLLFGVLALSLFMFGEERRAAHEDAAP